MLNKKDGFIVWGSYGKVKDITYIGSHYCPICERERRFLLRVYYRIGHIDWIFKWIEKKEFFIICEVCEKGIQIEESKIKQIPELSDDNIFSFSERYGCLILLLIIGILFLLAIILPAFS